MPYRFRLSLAFAVCAAVAACSGEAPPTATDATAQAPGEPAKADIHLSLIHI